MAEEEARRRGDRNLTADHLALALARPGADGVEVVVAAGLDLLEWRDGIIRVLGWNEGGQWEREGRPASSVCDSPAERRFGGELLTGPDVHAVLDLAAAEAAANGEEIGPAHLVVGLLLAVDSVGAAGARWHGLTPGRVRVAAGLIDVCRPPAGGAPPGRTGPRREGAGALVLCGGGSAQALPAVLDLAPRPCSVVLVDMAWSGPRPSAESRRLDLEALVAAGAGSAVDSGLTGREDAFDSEVCERLAPAHVIWCTGGSVAALYDRLWATPALDAIVDAHQRGAVLGGVSAGATVWGTGTVSDYVSGNPEPLQLFGLLDDVVVFSHYFTSRERAFRERLRAFPGCRGVAVSHGGAVAVDPSGDLRPLCRDGAGMAGVLLVDPVGKLAVL
ncbi:MAG: Type 1 glutamine amidotransferase-like domain-containing protein [Acidimicrobiales bacterium]